MSDRMTMADVLAHNAKVAAASGHAVAKADFVNDDAILEKSILKFQDKKFSKRIRQSAKPLMNRLETEFYNFQWDENERRSVHIQAVTFKLANGLRYTPDFFTIRSVTVGQFAFEVKGAWVDGDSFPKLKMAASVFPEITWLLVWKKDGVWQSQTILP